VGATVRAFKGRHVHRAIHKLIDTADNMELVFGYLTKKSKLLQCFADGDIDPAS
jgi:hypothetical protein